MRDCFIELLRLEAVKNKNIMLLTGDLGFGVLDKYRETVPEQFLNIGIAEQNMTGVAAGLAIEGFKVFTYSIGNFFFFFCLEQIRYDVCYHDVDVKIISIGSGLGYGSLGASHHAIEDVAILRALPNMRIYTPSDYDEVCAVVDELMNTKGPGYIRLPKIKIEPQKRRKVRIDACNAIGSVAKGEFVLLTHGSTVEFARKIIEKLGIPCGLYTVPRIKPLPEESLRQLFSTQPRIITLEEHNLCGGFGSSICEFLADNDIRLPVIRLGLPDCFLSFGGTAGDLMACAGLTVENCVSTVRRRFSL